MNFPVFDLHCDTVTELLGRDLKGDTSLRTNALHIDLQRGAALGGYAQCFAFWTTTDIPLPRGIKPEDIFSDCRHGPRCCTGRSTLIRPLLSFW